MVRTYRYISADSHLEVPFQRWTHRVPEKYRDRAPRVVRQPQGGDVWVVEGRPVYYVGPDVGGMEYGRRAPFGLAYEDSAGTGSPEQRLQEQDKDDIDAEVLFPTVLGHRYMRSVADDEAYLAMVRAYNDWLADEYCAVDPDRLIGVGLLPMTGVDAAIREMERCAQIGLKTIVLTEYPSLQGYPTPEDDAFWAAAIGMGMPVTIHVQTGVGLAGDGRSFKYKREPKEMAGIMQSQGIVQRVARYGIRGALNAVQLTMSGVFDRFPKLRVFFAENQIGWIPHFLEQADTHYERHLPWAERLLGFEPLARPPSAYIREHCYWGFMWNPVGVQMRHLVGVDRIMWSTDFPHAEYDWGRIGTVIDENFAGVPEDEKWKMVAGNAIDFFHLDHRPDVGSQP